MIIFAELEIIPMSVQLCEGENLKSIIKQIRSWKSKDIYSEVVDSADKPVPSDTQEIINIQVCSPQTFYNFLAHWISITD
jgi:hypothetical protein